MNAARCGAAVLPYIGQALQQLGTDALKGGAFLVGVGHFNPQVDSPTSENILFAKSEFRKTCFKFAFAHAVIK